jgi:hypothetical protein
MSTLCSGCSSKKPSHISGSCMGNPNGTPCGATTTSYDFKLCDSCATAMGQCTWCQRPLNGSGTPHSSGPAAGVVFVTARDTDNGKTFTSMKVGEQVHIILDEDSWSGVEWAVDRCDPGLHPQIGTVFTPDPNDYQYGTRTFIIDIRNAASGNTGKIRLHEVTRSYYGYYGQSGGQVVPNGKKWECSVQVS